MVLEIKGNKNTHSHINELYNYLLNTKDIQKWFYMGMTVEIDPTVDFRNQNILIRWTDLDEGFNDKILVFSLEEFQSQFKKIND